MGSYARLGCMGSEPLMHWFEAEGRRVTKAATAALTEVDAAAESRAHALQGQRRGQAARDLQTVRAVLRDYSRACHEVPHLNVDECRTHGLTPVAIECKDECGPPATDDCSAADGIAGRPGPTVLPRACVPRQDSLSIVGPGRLIIAYALSGLAARDKRTVSPSDL